MTKNFKVHYSRFKIALALREGRTVQKVLILPVAVIKLSNSKEVQYGNVLVVDQPGVLTIPHKLLSHIVPNALVYQEFEPAIT